MESIQNNNKAVMLWINFSGSTRSFLKRIDPNYATRDNSDKYHEHEVGGKVYVDAFYNSGLTMHTAEIMGQNVDELKNLCSCGELKHVELETDNKLEYTLKIRSIKDLDGEWIGYDGFAPQFYKAFKDVAKQHFEKVFDFRGQNIVIITTEAFDPKVIIGEFLKKISKSFQFKAEEIKSSSADRIPFAPRNKEELNSFEEWVETEAPWLPKSILASARVESASKQDLDIAK